MAYVMVVDDEPSICWAFREFLTGDGHRVSIASTAEQAIEDARVAPPDVVLLDVRLPGLDGLSALARLKGLCPTTPVVIMTAHGTMQTAVDAVRGGAFDYLPKPFDLDQVRRLVRRAIDSREAPSQPDRRDETPGLMVGRSAPIQQAFKQIAIAAACAEPVLITGESGTGKELVARAIRQHSDRASQPFVPVHLAALPDSLAERELFGHERGAFTGADASSPGLLDRAAGGTIFFDEIAETPTLLQAKLLRVLDGGEYRAVGGGPDRHLRARVISATNRDLADWARTGRFRADLYYRLAVLTIHLPPLREHPDDIPLLWDHFVGRIVASPSAPLDPDSKLGLALLAHDWPGNIRELRNAAENAARAAQGGRIHVDHLPASVTTHPIIQPENPADDLSRTIEEWAAARVDVAETEGTPLHEAFVQAVEGPLLRTLYTWSHGNQARMARVLGLHRTTLRQKLRRLGLDRP
ncbi:sigma-54 dependent transcriptional regulator [Isosphaeraceae bacterium EP7]